MGLVSLESAPLFDVLDNHPGQSYIEIVCNNGFRYRKHLFRTLDLQENNAISEAIIYFFPTAHTRYILILCPLKKGNINLFSLIVIIYLITFECREKTMPQHYSIFFLHAHTLSLSFLVSRSIFFLLGQDLFFTEKKWK